MPVKRASTGDYLTGGTKDVSPQFLSISITQTAANTYTQVQTALPVNRFQQQGSKTIVLEFLKVFFDLPEPDTNPAAGGAVIAATCQLTTKSLSAINFSDPTVVSFAQKVVRGAFTAGGTYGTYTTDPYCFDMTDGAGHGVLVATDSLFIALNTLGFVSASSVTVKILYRFKEVSLQEYIGIVQAQQ